MTAGLLTLFSAWQWAFAMRDECVTIIKGFVVQLESTCRCRLSSVACYDLHMVQDVLICEVTHTTWLCFFWHQHACLLLSLCNVADAAACHHNRRALLPCSQDARAAEPGCGIWLIAAKVGTAEASVPTSAARDFSSTSPQLKHLAGR